MGGKPVLQCYFGWLIKLVPKWLNVIDGGRHYPAKKLGISLGGGHSIVPRADFLV
jgi:hypothetical protein